MLNVVDILFRVKTETENLRKFQNNLIDTSTKHKLMVREMQDGIRVQKAYVKGLKALHTEGSTSYEEGQDELLDMVTNLKNVKDAHDKNSASIRKSTMRKKEQVKELTRFKGEWLGIMFVAQAAAAPFMEILTKVMGMTGAFEVFGAILTAILLPILMPFANMLIKLAMWIMKNKETVGKLVAAFIIFVAVAGTILAVVAMVVLAITGLAASAVAGSVALIIGIIAAIGALISVILVWGKDMWNNLKDMFTAIGLVIGIIWDNITEKTRNFVDGVVGFFSNMGNSIVQFLQPVLTWFDNLWDKIKNIGFAIGDFFGGIGNFLGLGKEQFGGDIKKSGMYYLHAGEEVISNSPAGSQGGTFNNISISDVNVSDNIDIDSLARRVGNQLGRGI